MTTSLLTRVLFAAGTGICLIYAADIKTDYDRDTDFGKYKTYSIGKVKATDDIWDARITKALDTELSAKGWSKVESGGDVTVTAFGSTKNQQSMSTFYDGFGGGGWGWRRGFGGGMGMGESTTSVVNTPVGTLNVDMFDTQSKKLIWRGSSVDTLSSKASKNEKKLESDIGDMFKKFPPKSKG